MQKHLLFTRHYIIMLSILLCSPFMHTEQEQHDDVAEKRVVSASCCSNFFEPAETANNAGNIEGIVDVVHGGTGLSAVTAYAVLCGGTTSTADLQPIASVGAANSVLTSNGAGALPTFQTLSTLGAFTSVTVQRFTSSDTYTPTTGMKFCIVEAIGGGGGGGGCAASANAASPGAGSGGYTKAIITAAGIGASKAVAIGAAGTAGSSGANAGGAGGNTTLGTTLVVANGGSAGPAGSTSVQAGSSGGTAGSASGTGVTLMIALAGQNGSASNPIANGFSGAGGNSLYGQGGTAVIVTTAGTGNAGGIYGGGAGGSTAGGAGSATAGSAGAAGVMIITEFC